MIVVRAFTYFTLFGFLSLHLMAQGCFVFGGNQGDYAYDLIRTFDGGYLMVGATNSFGFGSQDGYIVRFDVAGNLLWSAVVGGTADDWLRSAIELPDGTIMAVGTTFSFGSGNSDIYLLKLQSDGTILWSRTFGGSAAEQGFKILFSADSQIVILGITSSYGQGDEDMYLIKIDTAGNVLWHRTIGSWGNEGAYDGCCLTDTTCVIVGYTTSFGAGWYDVYVVKIDANGTPLWSTTIGGNFSDGYVDNVKAISSIVQTQDKGFLIASSSYSFGPSAPIYTSIYLIKLDSSGNYQWSKTIGGSRWEYSEAIKKTSDGFYVLVGTTASFGSGDDDVYLIKLNDNGDTLWTRTLGNNDYEDGTGVVPLSGGEVIVGGYTWSFGNGDYDFLLMRVDINGNTCSLCQTGWGGEISNHNSLIGSGWDTASGIQINSGVNATSGGTLIDLCGPLSVENIHLRAYVKNNIVTLYWQAPYSQEIRYYKVYRATANQAFLPISVTNQTTYQDTLFHSGIIYYYVEATTINGERLYSSVAKISIYKPFSLLMDKSHLVIEAKEEIFQVSLYDAMGRQLQQLRPLKEKVVISLKNYAMGFYLLEVHIKGKRYKAIILR